MIVQLQSPVARQIYQTMHIESLILGWSDLKHVPEVYYVHKLKLSVLFNAPSINLLR